MKKKSPNNIDIIDVMTKIQEQLAVLDQKLDTFMTKSLNELAQVLAASKPVYQAPAPVVVSPSRSSEQRPGRPLYAVVCFDCGKDTEIPFKPTGNRPVYCKECFAKRKNQTLKPQETKPQGFSIAASPVVSEPTKMSSVDNLPLKKKKSVSRKAQTKKKVVVKKTAKRK